MFIFHRNLNISWLNIASVAILVVRSAGSGETFWNGPIGMAPLLPHVMVSRGLQRRSVQIGSRGHCRFKRACSFLSLKGSLGLPLARANQFWAESELSPRLRKSGAVLGSRPRNPT